MLDRNFEGTMWRWFLDGVPLRNVVAADEGRGEATVIKTDATGRPLIACTGDVIFQVVRGDRLEYRTLLSPDADWVDLEEFVTDSAGAQSQPQGQPVSALLFFHRWQNTGRMSTLPPDETYVPPARIATLPEDFVC